MDACANLVETMRVKERRFKVVCKQLVLMNNSILYSRRRYERAVNSNKRSFRYPLRVTLMTLEGVRNIFTEYATKQADELDAMEKGLLEKYGVHWEDIIEEEEMEM